MYHRTNVDPDNNEPYCRFCNLNEYETFIHLVSSCPRFERQRLSQLKTQKLWRGDEWKLHEILVFANNTEIYMALNGEEEVSDEED
jgi:hypothetical protein